MKHFDYFVIRLAIHIFRTISEQIQNIKFNGVVMGF